MEVSDKKRLLIYCYLCIFLGIFSPKSIILAEESALRLVAAAELTPLKRQEGYLVVKLDVAGVAPSLTVTRLKNSGAFYLDET